MLGLPCMMAVRASSTEHASTSAMDASCTEKPHKLTPDTLCLRDEADLFDLVRNQIDELSDLDEAAELHQQLSQSSCLHRSSAQQRHCVCSDEDTEHSLS